MQKKATIQSRKYIFGEKKIIKINRFNANKFYNFA